MMDEESNTSKDEPCTTKKEGLRVETFPSVPAQEVTECKSGYAKRTVSAKGAPHRKIRSSKRKTLYCEDYREALPKTRKLGDSTVSDGRQSRTHKYGELSPSAEAIANAKEKELDAANSESRVTRTRIIGSSSDEDRRSPGAEEEYKTEEGAVSSHKPTDSAFLGSERRVDGGTSDSEKVNSFAENSSAVTSMSASAVDRATCSENGDLEGVNIVKQMVAELKRKEQADPTMVDGWYNWLDDLLEHYAKHGHCQVRDAENHVLYSWLKRQRIMYRKGKLEPDKLRILQLLKTNGFDVPANTVSIAGSSQVEQQAQQQTLQSHLTRNEGAARVDAHSYSEGPALEPRRSAVQDAEGASQDTVAALSLGRELQPPLTIRMTSQTEESLIQRLSTQSNPEHVATLWHHRGGAHFASLPRVSSSLQTTASQLLSTLRYPDPRMSREDTPSLVARSSMERFVAAADPNALSSRSAAAGLLERSISALVATDPLRRLQQTGVSPLPNPLEPQNSIQHLLFLHRRQQQQRQMLLDEFLRSQLQGRDGDRPD